MPCPFLHSQRGGEKIRDLEVQEKQLHSYVLLSNASEWGTREKWPSSHGHVPLFPHMWDLVSTYFWLSIEKTLPLSASTIFLPTHPRSLTQFPFQADWVTYSSEAAGGQRETGTGIRLGWNELGNIFNLPFEVFIALSSNSFSSLAGYWFFWLRKSVSSLLW